MHFDDDFWADTDLDNSGMETSFDEYPEGYVFTCCNKYGTEEGCANHMHVSHATVTTKKARRE